MNTLITFFSATGTTKRIANSINSYIYSNIFEIIPKRIYTSEDLDWTNDNSRSSIEVHDKESRPEIYNIDDISNYNKIIIGFPVWWDMAPHVINTFVESNDLSNKKLYVFVTSGSSSVDNSFNVLKEKYPNLNWISAKRFTGFETEETIKEWLGE